MHRFFSLDLPFTLFLRNVVLVSVAALVPVLLVYVATRPGFATMLLDGGPALSRFLRQVVTNGLPVVVVVNYVSFFLFAWMNAGTALRQTRDTATFVLIDLGARLLGFVALHAVIYVLSADWFGSFGGSRTTALSVLAPTLARSALFENISGAYLYATLVSAVPLHAEAITHSARLGRIARLFPGASGPVIMALAVFGLFAIALSGLMELAARW